MKYPDKIIKVEIIANQDADLFLKQLQLKLDNIQDNGYYAEVSYSGRVPTADKKLSILSALVITREYIEEVDTNTSPMNRFAKIKENAHEKDE